MDWLLEPQSCLHGAGIAGERPGGRRLVLSCYMTLKGWALMGDAVSHAVLPGVVVAYALACPFARTCFRCGFRGRHRLCEAEIRVKEDTVIGLVFTGFFALGLVLVSKTRSNIDLTHISSAMSSASPQETFSDAADLMPRAVGASAVPTGPDAVLL